MKTTDTKQHSTPDQNYTVTPTNSRLQWENSLLCAATAKA